MRRTGAAVAAAAIITLTGCGADAGVQDTPPSSSTVAAESTTTAAAPPTSIRGATLKQFGQESAFECDDQGLAGTCALRFVIGPPEPATNCYAGAEAKHGTVLAFPVQVTTDTTFDPSKYTGVFYSQYFSVLRETGVTVRGLDTDAALGCDQNSNTFIDAFSPASRYEAYVTLDVPTDAEALLFLPVQASVGWEYAMPDALPEAAPSAAAPIPDAIVPAPAQSPPAAAVPDTDPAPPASGPPNPYPNSRDTYGRATGTGGSAFVECADPNVYQRGTGVFADGSMDYAPQCAG